MSTTPRTATFAVDVMSKVVDRRNVVRAARFALYRGGIAFGVNRQINGEFALPKRILDLVPRGSPVCVIDVGANVGQWARPFLDVAKARDRLEDVDLHALESCTETFRQLADALRNSPASVQQIALSDHPGKAILHIAPGKFAAELVPQCAGSAYS